MKVLILGGDGYLGWPTALYLAENGYEVLIIDNCAKRMWEAECGVTPLFPVNTLEYRCRIWNNMRPDNQIKFEICDISRNRHLLYVIIDRFSPDVVVHYAEQPSAPYSMMSAGHCIYTHENNVLGNLNLIMAVLHHNKDIHIIKLGTMGEYGTPRIPIEEGWLDVEHKGKKDRVLYPKKPGSWYHLTKVHDSHNLEFACRTFGMKITDLNQGPVYGISTHETWFDKRLRTSFHYDHIFGTVVNRFVAQAVIGEPLTIYGRGGQTRGYININDTVECVRIVIENPPEVGEFRVMNQIAEIFTLNELAALVKDVAEYELMQKPSIAHIANPRVEDEEHDYEVEYSKLGELGLIPLKLKDVLPEMLREAYMSRGRIDRSVLMPTVEWVR